MNKDHVFKGSIIECPVCLMGVESNELNNVHLGVMYYFCSIHCYNRFLRYSGLYCGDPKHGKSVRQCEIEIIKTSYIILKNKVTDQDKHSMQQMLRNIKGVKNSDISNNELFISYDLIQVSLDEIEKNLSNQFNISPTIFSNMLNRKWIHYAQACELENLANPANGDCC